MNGRGIAGPAGQRIINGRGAAKSAARQTINGRESQDRPAGGTKRNFDGKA